MGGENIGDYRDEMKLGKESAKGNRGDDNDNNEPEDDHAGGGGYISPRTLLRKLFR